MDDFLEFLAVSCEEYGTGSWTIANAYYVTLNNLRAIWSSAEWLIVMSRSVGVVRDRVFVIA